MIHQGTLELDENGNPVCGSTAFNYWIIHEKIVAGRGEEPQEKFEKWLHDKQYKLGNLITNEHIAFLQKIWKGIPSGMIEAARKFFSKEK